MVKTPCPELPCLDGEKCEAPCWKSCGNCWDTGRVSGKCPGCRGMRCEVCFGEGTIWAPCPDCHKEDER